MPRHPRRADGLTLLGEFAGSGLDRPVFLARRADGQVVAVTQMLARILEAADGTRDVAAIARLVGQDRARPTSGADVAYLVADRLMPLGLIAAESGVTPAPRARAPFMIAARHTVLPAPAVQRISRVFAVFFRPAVMVALLTLLVAADIWMFGRHSVREGAAQVLATPELILVMVGLALAGSLLHEFGHAAACRYGGARPGVIGFGMYLVWPAFFTDVTDSYRLSRAGRLRTDLGGIYFNGLFALLLAGAFAVTGAEVLMVAALIAHFDAVRQLAPFVRLDGYYVVSDLAGVPDLFSRMGPALRPARPRRQPGRRVGPQGHRAGRRSGRRPRLWPSGTPASGRRPGAGAPPGQPLTGLTRSARIMVALWALITVPLLLVNLVLLVLSTPFVLTRTTHSVRDELGQAVQAIRGGEAVTALAEIVSVVVVTLPAAGLLFVLFLLGRSLARAVLSRRRRSLPGPAHRTFSSP